MVAILKRIAPALGAEVLFEPEFRIVGRIRFRNGRQSFFWHNKFNLNSVSAARIEICAVSRSRVSPTRMTSGSWRRKERRAAAKVRPTCSLICTWLTPLRLYST